MEVRAGSGVSIAHLVVPSLGQYEIAVFDVSGRSIRSVFEGALLPGEHEITWDHRDGANRPVASGAYFLRARRIGGNHESATARSVIVR